MLKIVKGILVALEGVVALGAISGGIGLMKSGHLGLPIEYLNNTPFDSYFWPGVILTLIIGGTHILALIANVRKLALALPLSAIAAFGLLIWLFVELYLINRPFWMQVLYFALGIICLTLIIVCYELSLKAKRQ